MRQDVQPAAVRHADHHLASALVGGVAEDDVEHRHEGIEPLDAEAFLAEVGLVQEALEGLDAHQALEQRDPVIGLHRPPMLARLDHAAEPDSLGVRRDVLDLVGDRPGVGLTEVRERLRQRRARHVDPHELGRDLGHRLARQPESLRVEGGVARRLGAEWVEMRRHVPEVAIGLHERHAGGDGLELLVDRAIGRQRRRRGRGFGRRGHRLVGRDVRGPCAERREGIGVEAVLAVQQPLDAAQEEAGFGTLDDAVVVGRRDRHPPIGRDASDRAGGDDRALVRHQPWHARGGPKRPRVGERDRRAGHVVDAELAAARRLDELLVAGVECGEVHAVGALDDRDDQEAAPVATLDVDRQAQVDGAGVDPERLPIRIGEVVAHRALLAGRLHDRPADQVGEAHLARRDLVVQLLASRLERRDVELAEARRGRHRQAGRHVLRQPRGRPLDRGRSSRDRWRRRRRRCLVSGGRGGWRSPLVAVAG